MNLKGFEPLTLTRMRMMLLSISSGILNALLPESKRALGTAGRSFRTDALLFAC
jgi:hypothetical protein